MQFLRGFAMNNVRTVFMLTYFIFFFSSHSFSQQIQDDSMSTYNKGQYNASKTSGNIAEKVMDGFFVNEWTKKNGMVGIQGIDGLYIKTTPSGVVQEVLVVESKYNKSVLGKTKNGVQMSQEWINAKMDSLIYDIDKQIQKAKFGNDLNRISELERTHNEYRQIKKHIVNNNYRGRLFHAEIIDSKISITLNDFSKDGTVIASTKPKPTQVSLANPPKSRYERGIYNNFYTNYEDELIRNGFTRVEAKKIVGEAQHLFKSKNISSTEFHKYNRDKYIKLFDSKINNANSLSEKLYYSVLKKNKQIEGLFPEKYQNAAQSAIHAAMVTSMISMGINGYQVLFGEMDVEDAAKNIFKDTSLSAGSVFISEAILVNLGDKYALQSMVPHGVATNLGLATFIFDESVVLYNYFSGDINSTEFLHRSSEAIVKSGSSYLATYCTVALKLTTSGPVIMAIAMGGYILADQGIKYYQKMNSRNYLTYEDLLGKVPVNIKNRTTLYNAADRSNRSTIYNAEKLSDRTTIHNTEKSEKVNLFNIEERSQRKTIYNYENQ
jgi:hypothetical protein